MSFLPACRPTVGRARACATMQAEVAAEPEPYDPVAFTKSLPGITGPLGYFDPLGFCSGEASEERVRFLREAELKHGRVAMMAAFGFVLAENFHPIFPSCSVPSYLAFQATPLQENWKVTLAVIGLFEIASINTFLFPIREGWVDGVKYTKYEAFMINKEHVAGDFGFTLLKPTDAAELKEMQTKELNNGRLAMMGIFGMIAQELATGGRLF